MTRSDFHHVSILLEETIQALAIRAGGVYVDCTTGGAGHASAVLKQLNQTAHLICMDRDTVALNVAQDRLLAICKEKRSIVALNDFDSVDSNNHLSNPIIHPDIKADIQIMGAPRVSFVHQSFDQIKNALAHLQIQGVDGMMADLGVSSYQLDEPSRGFSYMQAGPLDMRMDPSCGEPVSTFLQFASLDELIYIFKTYGEERYAAPIARRIVETRVEHPLKTTTDLVDLILKSIPTKARKEKQHPAKRVFQALRIFINGELEQLERLLDDALSVLNPSGRIAIITFHSLEDRIVKQRFKTWANPCECPSHLPCICGKTPKGRIIEKKGVLPSAQEVKDNPRARSARLRVFEKSAKEAEYE